MCSMTTLSSTCSFPSLMSSMSCKSKSPRKVRQKKRGKIGGGSCPPGKCTVFGGGKCQNLGVVNVRNLGVVNVRLANDLPPSNWSQPNSTHLLFLTQNFLSVWATNFVKLYSNPMSWFKCSFSAFISELDTKDTYQILSIPPSLFQESYLNFSRPHSGEVEREALRD